MFINWFFEYLVYNKYWFFKMFSFFGKCIKLFNKLIIIREMLWLKGNKLNYCGKVSKRGFVEYCIEND